MCKECRFAAMLSARTSLSFKQSYSQRAFCVSFIQKQRALALAASGAFQTARELAVKLKSKVHFLAFDCRK
eukprot:m.59688 g.59688  ORF g.59688 m.59688 type:complete len:71 (+) comp34894_c0_seq4:1291-1503(+)